MGRPIPCFCCESLLWDGIAPVAEFLTRFRDDYKGNDGYHAPCLLAEIDALCDIVREELHMGREALERTEMDHTNSFVRELSTIIRAVTTGRHAELADFPSPCVDGVFNLLVCQVRDADDWNGWMRRLWELCDYGSFHDPDMPFHWRAISSRESPALERAFRDALERELVEEDGHSPSDAKALVDSRLGQMRANF